jgi:ribosomal protein S18 acetylase RimI-like enzyme
VVTIRAATFADAAAISAVQRASWFGAYEGIVDAAVIDRVTTPDDGARIRQTFRTRPWQRMIVACAPAGADQPSVVAPPPAVIGYASFGPEREVLGAPWPHPVTTAGAEGQIAELYALYVHPDWWSAGAGRAMMDRVLAATARSGFTEITLWVLEKNIRARRFYERAGYSPDRAVNILDGLGGVPEVRYRRPLSHA